MVYSKTDLIWSVILTATITGLFHNYTNVYGKLKRISKSWERQIVSETHRIYE